MNFDALIIGGGLDGLICGALLARQGMRVAVLESRTRIGGRHCPLEVAPLFRAQGVQPFETPVRPAIAAALSLSFPHQAHDPVVHYLNPEGPSLTLWRDRLRTIQEINKLSPQDGRSYGQFLAFRDRFQNMARTVLDQAPCPAQSNDFFQLLGAANLGLALRQMGSQDVQTVARMVTQSADDFLSEWFSQETVKCALVAPALYEKFAGPRSPGTAVTLFYNGLAGEFGLPRGGYGTWLKALSDVILDSGGSIRPNTTIKTLLMRDGRAVGALSCEGEEFLATAVISELDAPHTLLKLLPPLELEPSVAHRLSRIRSRGVTTVLNLALAGLPHFHNQDGPVAAEALRGRIQLASSIEALERAFDSCKYGRLPDHPLLEVVIPSLADPTLAPSGRHVMQVRISWTPYTLAEGQWNEARRRLEETVLARLEQAAPGLREQIVESQLWTPPDLEKEFGLTEGHLHQGEHNLNQLYFGRPIPGHSSYATPVENLYLCGPSTHPGGLAGGACGANAAREVLSRRQPADIARKVKSAVATPVGAGLAVGGGLAALGLGLAATALVRRWTRTSGNGTCENGTTTQEGSKPSDQEA